MENNDVLILIDSGHFLLPAHVLPASHRHPGSGSHSRPHSLLCHRQQQAAAFGEFDGYFLQLHLLHGHVQQLHEGHLHSC